MARNHIETGRWGSLRDGRGVARLAPVVAAALAAAVALALSIRTLSDLPGSMKTSRLDLIGYSIAVLGVAAFLAYADHRRDSSGKRPRPQPDRTPRQR